MFNALVVLAAVGVGLVELEAETLMDNEDRFINFIIWKKIGIN